MQYQQSSSVFGAKVILFGEYSILTGSSAALIPYHKLKASLVFPEIQTTKNSVRSDKRLQGFTGYLRELQQKSMMQNQLDTKQFSDDVKKGLYLKSNIPENYGLGSSGAICAAIYDRYHTNNIVESLEQLRKFFGLMESYYHGSSSGIDPLCIYLDKPMIIKNDKVQFIEKKSPFIKDFVQPFLIDSGIKSNTEPLVKHFNELMQDTHYKSEFINSYIPLVNRAVEEWQNSKFQMDTLFTLSLMQLEFFKKMIPESFRRIFNEGIEEKLFALKICGSGGGGMILGFTADIDATRNFILDNFNKEIEPFY